MFSVKNWIKEIAFPHECCESLKYSQGPDSKSGSQILKTHKNEIHSILRDPVSKVHDSLVYSNLKYSFFSPTLYIETVKVKAQKEALLDFAVRRYIKKMNLFEEGFNFCYDILSYKDKSAVVNIFALSSADASEIIKTVPHTTKPVSCIVPLEYVLTQLLANTVENPVISVWVERQQVLVLATKGKEIISRGTYKQQGDDGEFIEWLISNKFIQNVFDLVNRQEDNPEISLLVWGESYRNLQKTIQERLNIHIDKNLESKINRKLDWKGKLGEDSTSSGDVYRDAVFSNPSLFGLPICRKSQTFISPNYNVTYSKFMHSRYALIASLVICMVFATLNMMSYLSQSEWEDRLMESKVSLETGIRHMNSRIPDEKRLTSVLEKSKFKAALDSELNVKNFLSWVTNIAPNRAVIDQLLIEGKSEIENLANKKPNRSAKKILTSKQYTVELRLTLNRAYTDSVTQIDTFFTKLNERVKSPQSKFIYLNADDKVPSALSLTFLVEPAMFF